MSVYRPGPLNTSGGKRARRVTSVTLDGQRLALRDVLYADTRRGVVRTFARMDGPNSAYISEPTRDGKSFQIVVDERRGRVVVKTEPAR